MSKVSPRLAHRFRFTERSLAALPLATPQDRRVEYADDSTAGFVCRCTLSERVLYVRRKQRGAGRLVFVRLGNVGDKPLAEYRAEAEAVGAELAAGNDPTIDKPKRGAITLQAALDQYIAAATLRPTTIRSYREDIAAAFGSYATRPLAALDASTVARLHRERSAASPARADGALRVLRAVYRYTLAHADAHNVELALRDPLAMVKAARAWNGAKRRDRSLDAAELKAWRRDVLALPDDEPQAAIRGRGSPKPSKPSQPSRGRSLSGTQRDALLLIATTGLRLREALHLSWQEVNLTAATITLSAERMKGGRSHTLPIPPRLLALLKRRREAAPASAFVFGNGDMPLDRISVRVFDLISVDAGAHDLRRTIASWLGTHAPAYVVKAILSHADPAKSADVTAGYVQVKAEDLRPWLVKWEAVLHGRAR